MPLLEVKGLDVHYGAIQALNSVNLHVDEGEIVALLGANGAGKTTTLRAISNLVKPTRGEVTFAGENITKRQAHTLAAIGISHVPEGRGIFPEQTVEENLWLGAYSRKDRTDIKKDFDRVYDFFPRVKERLHQRAGTLSGGEQQMLAIGRALLSRPRLLLLDEPSLGLAPQIVKVIFKIIKEINEQGTTILLVEQNAHMALQASHRGYVLEVGEIVLADDAKALAATDSVKKAYLGED